MSQKRVKKSTSLGHSVKELREDLHLNQKQLADASGVTQDTISRLESGAVKQLKSDALSRLAQALGVSVEYLLRKQEPYTRTLVTIDKKDGRSIFHTTDPVLNRILRCYQAMNKPRRRQLMEYAVFLSDLKSKN